MESLSIRSSESASVRAERLRVLKPAFYHRHTVEVARELLGKLLVVQTGPNSRTVGRIVETEAYRAGDPASHSARGQTPRSKVMFADGGVAYVYFIYGMYEMLNFVCEPAGDPGAVLIRGLEPIEGERVMARRRRLRVPPADALPASLRRFRRQLASGPGKLCRAMGIRLSHNGASLQGPVIRVLDDGFRPERISTSGRVGIRVAREVPWRFFITGNEFVSRVNPGARIP